MAAISVRQNFVLVAYAHIFTELKLLNFSNRFWLCIKELSRDVMNSIIYTFTAILYSENIYAGYKSRSILQMACTLVSRGHFQALLRMQNIVKVTQVMIAAFQKSQLDSRLLQSGVKSSFEKQ